MNITRKWFAEVTAEHARETAASETALAPAFSKIVDAIGDFEGNLERLQTRRFVASLDLFRDDVEDALNSDTSDDDGHEPWLVAHDMLTLRMHLYIAYLCRVRAEQILSKQAQQLIANPGSWGKLTTLQFQTLASWIVESGESRFCSKLNAIHKKLPSDRAAELRPFMRGVALASGDRDGYKLKSAAAISNDDRPYADFFAGKRIAIVGPVDTGRKNGAEIDEFDIVVRFNHSDAAVYNTEKFGSKTDVSYYTDPAFKKVVIGTSSKLPGLSFASVQRLDSFTADQFQPLETTVREQYRRSNIVFFKSHANAMQRLLFDIARFDVKEIKAFNMDMWVTAHDKNYMARRSKMDPHMFIHHDLIANLIFTKRVVAGGVLFADDMLARILLMRPRDYILRLELIHGEFFRQAQDAAAT